MTVTIKRGSKASEQEGFSAGKSYAAQAITDGNVIVLDDKHRLVPISFSVIGDDCDWEVVKDKAERTSSRKSDEAKE